MVVVIPPLRRRYDIPSLLFSLLQNVSANELAPAKKVGYFVRILQRLGFKVPTFFSQI